MFSEPGSCYGRLPYNGHSQTIAGLLARPEKGAAVGLTVPDVIAPDLKELFCGIHPNVYPAVVKHNFVRPGTRFWSALFAAGAEGAPI